MPLDQKSYTVSLGRVSEKGEQYKVSTQKIQSIPSRYINSDFFHWVIYDLWNYRQKNWVFFKHVYSLFPTEETRKKLN